MTKPKYYETEEFKKLSAAWEKKLVSIAPKRGFRASNTDQALENYNSGLYKFKSIRDDKIFQLYLDGYSYSKIGKEIGLHRTNVSRLIERILRQVGNI